MFEDEILAVEKKLPGIFVIGAFLFALANPIVALLVRRLWFDRLMEYQKIEKALMYGHRIGFVVKPIFYIFILMHPGIWMH